MPLPFVNEERTNEEQITDASSRATMALVSCRRISLDHVIGLHLYPLQYDRSKDRCRIVSDCRRFDYGILHLSEPEGLTSATDADLLKQCQSGLLTDVQTELSMRDWFLIVQYYTVTASAVCKPPPPPPPPPSPPPPTAKIILRGVHFAFNKYNIRPADTAVLDEAAATLKQNPNVRIQT
jgi:hypothetical protein